MPEEQLLEPWPDMHTALSECLLFGHNGMFDAVVQGYNLAGVNDPLPLYSDSQLLHYVLYPAAQENGLKQLGGKFYGIPNWKLPDYTNMRQYTREELHTYCAKDVQVTFMLEDDLTPIVATNERLLNVLNTVLMPAANTLAWINWHGFAFDIHYVRDELIPLLEDERQSTLSIIERTAEKIAPDVEWPRRKDAALSEFRKPVWYQKFNPASPDQIKKLYAVRGKNLAKTDEDTMRGLAQRGDGFALNLLTFRKVSKQLSTYARRNMEFALSSKAEKVLPGFIRVMPSYNLHTTLTGRLSSNDPNIQNQPRDERFKRMFIASDYGRVLMQADYGQAELRVMAAESGDRWLIDLFANPQVDIFNQMLPVMFPNRVPKTPEEAKEMRAQLKGVVYGMAYGRQARAIALDLGIPVPEAQRIIKDFLRNAEGLAEWRRGVLTRLHDGTGLTTRFGRYFQHDVITSANKGNVERSALSFIPQSSASDCCLLAATKLVAHIRKEKLDWFVAALVHDSITLDVPNDEAHLASLTTREFMVAEAQAHYPEVLFTTDGKSGWSWDETG